MDLFFAPGRISIAVAAADGTAEKLRGGNSVKQACIEEWNRSAA
jgi:hypothetical protein